MNHEDPTYTTLSDFTRGASGSSTSLNSSSRISNSVNTHNRRWMIIPWVIVIVFCIIIIRLFHLQIKSSYALFQLSNRNYLRFEKITPPRGNILDCHGELIATNRPIAQLTWTGTGSKKLNSDQQTALETLETLFDQNFINNSDVIKAEQHGKNIVLLGEVNFEKLSQILELFPHHKNITIKTTFKRFYPHQATACHILGYLNGMSYEPTGEMGLEKLFNIALRGIPGQMITTINSIGQNLRQQEIQRALNGNNIYTTLDMKLHKIAENCFPQDYRGTILLMDAQTGALRVMLSRPDFDPNLFLQSLSHEQWQNLQGNQPFLNRALAGQYPPASLFKLITIIAGLEQQIIAEDTSWVCNGYVEFCKRKYHCKRRSGHGKINTQEALAQSCNVPFYEIGKRIKIDTLAYYAHMLGLGTKTTLLLPERSGLIPTSQWKRKTFGKPWWPGETLSASLGQSFMLVTPIQMCRAINAICEGSLITPRILETELIVKEPIDISHKTLEFIKSSMQQVVHHGTGQRLRVLKNMVIRGKTGTAQVRGLSKTNPDEDIHDEHGWVALHIQYKDFDPFDLIVLVEHCGSALVAVDAAKDFLKAYCRHMDGKI